ARARRRRPPPGRPGARAGSRAGDDGLIDGVDGRCPPGRRRRPMGGPGSGPRPPPGPAHGRSGQRPGRRRARAQRRTVAASGGRRRGSGSPLEEGGGGRVTARPTRTLVMWCPDWPVTAAGFGPDEAVAVLFANRVVACSAAARAGGVHRGLRRRQAEARCSGLITVGHDPNGDARAFEPVVAAVEAFCPRVEIVRPGVCAVATRGPSRYFGGDEALAARVTEAVAHVGGRAGIADGPFAAELSARAGRVIPNGETPAFLATFSVDVLERPDLSDLLHRLGIRTLGAFAALPPEA